MSENQLKAESHVINDGYGYKDVDTYVKMPDGSEWLFRTYRDYDNAEVTRCKPRFSEAPDADFGDEGVREAPVEVLAAYEAALPEIERLLEPTVATTIDSGLSGLTIAPASPLVGDFVFHVGDQKLTLKADGLYLNDRKTETTEEQDAAFRSFLDGMIGLLPKSRIPLVISTQSAGLRPASEFDAIEIHEMVYDDELGYMPSTRAGDDAQYDPDAISVFVHCKAGGTECVADFPFDPSEPGTEAAARAAADALAASVGSVIANAHAHLPHTYIMRQGHLDLIEGALKHG